MRHKMITLCLNSFEIAQKMPNFSSWVREKILEERDEAAKVVIFSQTFVYECPVCHKIKEFPTQDMAWRCNKCNVPLDFVTVIV